MKKLQISRRDFVEPSAVIAASLPLNNSLGALMESSAENKSTGIVKLKWIDEKPPALSAGATWGGVPWPQGQFKKNAAFALETSAGTKVVQSCPDDSFLLLQITNEVYYPASVVLQRGKN